MIEYRLLLRRVAVKALTLFVSGLVVVAFVSQTSAAEREAEAILSKSKGTFQSPLIDLVIPSRPDDLFVVLKNGLTILIRESRTSDVVSTQVMVGTGSVYEGERSEGGLSHYLEHVVSGGTTSKLTEKEIKERLQAMGGASNAYTSYDKTVYFINTTQQHYKEALSLLLAYVTDCQFDETEYRREKNVIAQEFKMGENDPSRQLWYLFMRTAYWKHPVRYPIIGQEEVFKKMGREDLIAHYNRWYTPGDMIVSIVGNVDKIEALRTVVDLARDLKRAAEPLQVLPAEPPQLVSRRVEKSLPMARITQAQIGFRTVALTHDDLYPIDVLAVVMGDGRTSRLYKTVRDEKGLALSVGASSWTPVFEEGQFLISMDLPYENLPKAIEAVMKEISAVQTDSVSEESLKRAKHKVIAEYVFSQEEAQNQARQLASDWSATGDPYFSESYVSKIQQVTREDVRRAARKYLQNERMTLAVIKPEDASDAWESKAAHTNVVNKAQKIILPNYMTLLLKRNMAAPVVNLRFVLKGGLRFEPKDRPGLSSFMSSLLTKGTKNRTKLEIANAIEAVGGTIGSGSGNNLVSVSVSVLKKDFDIALDLLSDVVLRPSFPDVEIEKQRRETLVAIQRLDEYWTTEIARLFKRHYYRKHPYRNDVIGSKEAVEKFSRKEIRDFYESIFVPNNAVLAVYGAIDPEAVTAMVQEAFEGFEARVLEQPNIEMETENITQDKTFEFFNEKTAVAIMLGYNGLTLRDHDRPVVDVLDAIVSGIGYPGGWLHDSLRGGNKSLVYYVHAYPAFGIDGGYFAVMAQTSEDNYKEVLEIIRDKMALIQNVEVDAVTLKRARDICITTHELGLETIASQASSCAINEILGLGFDYDRKYPGLIKQVTSADVLRVARRLLPHHLTVTTKPKGE